MKFGFDKKKNIPPRWRECLKEIATYGTYTDQLLPFLASSLYMEHHFKDKDSVKEDIKDMVSKIREACMKKILEL